MQVKDQTPIAYSCDTAGCTETLQTEATHPDAAIAVLRASRWGESSTEDGAPLHHCPNHA